MSPLAAEDVRRLRAQAAAADAAGDLQPQQQALLHERGWLTLLAPRSCGGLELPLPQAVRLEEALAAADGSTGWVVTLCAGAAWFAGFWNEALARQVIGTPRACLAGSGAATGWADREGEGWRLTGRWDFASGAPMATHFTLNAVLREGGEPLRDAAGTPRVQAFVVPAAQVRVVPNWHAIGLRASASHSFALDGAWVPADHGFMLEPGAAQSPGPLYRFPFMPLAYVTLAANVCGMARDFLERATPVVVQRRHLLEGSPLGERPAVQALLRELPARLDAARVAFYAQLDAAWQQVAAGAPVSDAGCAALQAASLALVEAARDSVDRLFPLCGLQGADTRSDLNRAWRDFHTATQHGLFAP